MLAPRSPLLVSLGSALIGFALLLLTLFVFRVPAVWFPAFLGASVLSVSFFVGLVQASTLLAQARQRWSWICIGMSGWVLSLLVAMFSERPLERFALSYTSSSGHGYTLPASVLISGLLAGSSIGIGQSLILQLAPRRAATWISATISLYLSVWILAGIRTWIT
jgi:hypothetical protein